MRDSTGRIPIQWYGPPRWVQCSSGTCPTLGVGASAWSIRSPVHKARFIALPGKTLDASIRRMARTPDSGITMCHAQGKTAVYLSDDKTCIVEHPPHGPIKRIPL